MNAIQHFKVIHRLLLLITIKIYGLQILLWFRLDFIDVSHGQLFLYYFLFIPLIRHFISLELLLDDRRRGIRLFTHFEFIGALRRIVNRLRLERAIKGLLLDVATWGNIYQLAKPLKTLNSAERILVVHRRWRQIFQMPIFTIICILSIGYLILFELSDIIRVHVWDRCFLIWALGRHEISSFIGLDSVIICQHEAFC